MTIFRCKMCGGDLEITPGSSVCECLYCGTQQTLPKLDDDRRANMYDRANHFRRNNEFDKAMSMYEKILEEDKTDSEAYWSLVLCRYGIEYVEDPTTHKRVPTVNRAQYTSVFMDENYKSAIEYADVVQKSVYEREAAAIDDIQKGILAISQQEEPFDVFICYKETGSDGRRTRDSVLANDLYHQLTQEGYKVFFARITLEDKLGQEYEPYIFAALNSAKVMIVIGTKPEYFNAVWVKNEWSRFLMLIKNGEKKTLIPAYRDMDPYDLPEEFSHLQAQDMSKLGFMQDLIRGIKKITESDNEKTVVNQTTVINNASAGQAEPLLKRAFMFLEDGDWNSAKEYCEKVLDLDPENARAYVGKLLAERRLRTQAELHFSKSKNANELFTNPIENSANYKKAVRFADEQLKATLEDYNRENIEEYFRLRYESAKSSMDSAATEQDFQNAAKLFVQIYFYKDSEELYNVCLEKAEYARKDSIYNDLVARFNAAHSTKTYNELREGFSEISGHRDAREYVQKCIDGANEAHLREEYNKAVLFKKVEESKEIQKDALKIFEKLSDYRDSAKLAEECRKRIEEIEREEEDKRIATEKAAKKAKFTQIISAVSAVIIVAAIIILPPMIKYNKAVTLLESGSYDEAISSFMELGDYKDSADKVIEAGNAKEYKAAELLLDSGDYENAITAFEALGNYSDSADRIKECYYDLGSNALDESNYDTAISNFEKASDYSDSNEKIQECHYEKGIINLEKKKYTLASEEFEKSTPFKDSAEKNAKAKEEVYKLGQSDFKSKKYASAISYFEAISGYKDADEMVKKCEDTAKKPILDLFKNKKYKDSLKEFKKSMFNGTTYYARFMRENGYGKEIDSFIEDLNNYEGEYLYGVMLQNSLYSYKETKIYITVDIENFTFTLSESYSPVDNDEDITFEYNFEKGNSTYVSPYKPRGSYEEQVDYIIAEGRKKIILRLHYSHGDTWECEYKKQE